MRTQKTNRVYSRFIGYTLEDCNCAYCLHYRGRKKQCTLEVCCCTEERQQALLRLRAKSFVHSDLSIEEPYPSERRVSDYAR